MAARKQRASGGRKQSIKRKVKRATKPAKKRVTKRATKRKRARSTGKTKRARPGGTRTKKRATKRKVKRATKPAKKRVTKRATKRKTARSKVAPKPVTPPSKASAGPPPRPAPPVGTKETLVEVGKIMHFFPIPKAAAIEITAEPLAIGDLIRIKGHTTNLRQYVTSMQIEHAPIEIARRGDVIGLHVEDRVREQDTVFKVMRLA